MFILLFFSSKIILYATVNFGRKEKSVGTSFSFIILSNFPFPPSLSLSPHIHMHKHTPTIYIRKERIKDTLKSQELISFWVNPRIRWQYSCYLKLLNISRLGYHPRAWYGTFHFNSYIIYLQLVHLLSDFIIWWRNGMNISKCVMWPAVNDWYILKLCCFFMMEFCLYPEHLLSVFRILLSISHFPAQGMQIKFNSR